MPTATPRVFLVGDIVLQQQTHLTRVFDKLLAAAYLYLDYQSERCAAIILIFNR
jgi:hypothetical protein